MTREEYIQQVEAVLRNYTSQAARRLEAALAIVPSKAQKAEIQIFVDQEGEGFLTIRVGLVGPDLYVLNRAIREHAELFKTRMTKTGLDPALLLMEPDGEAFSVHHTLTDCAASWLADVWKATDPKGFHLPISVVSPEDYGTITPIQLRHDSKAA